MKRTGNIVYEISSNSNPGCLLRSKAEWVFYLDLYTAYLYKINLHLLRKYIAEKREKLYPVPMGDGARGYLLSLTDLFRYRDGLIRNLGCIQAFYPHSLIKIQTEKRIELDRER